ncbi:ATP-binding cassette domain-containing protein, partial [Ellagibacter isourolithinifaciens]|uniref:ATP-binding cassette domain-containing protein n=1 Tax=Ellagibacter isourolithinifaciens TaxID=2137581 RepID=UPI003A9167EF
MSIDIEHVSFSYGKHQVLRDVNASIPDGVLVNVLGPNGVGKSTLFRCILCLNSDYEGVIRVNGKDLRDLSVRERAREISYIPQPQREKRGASLVDVHINSHALGLAPAELVR